jgi:hypothetical protein
LKQEQLAIAELYQEKKELRKQLAENAVEMTKSQSQEGNENWLKI